MVWHAYLLNPRNFFEDCVRSGKVDFYATPFPWQTVAGAIDSTTFEFQASDAAQKHWESSTGLRWDNLDDPPTKRIECPACKSPNQVPWTKDAGLTNVSSIFEAGTGYADADFRHTCTSCELAVINHASLRVMKFRQDMNHLTMYDVPMPGTILGTNGRIPKKPTKLSRGTWLPPTYFPSSIMKAGLHRELDDATRMTFTSHTMDDVRKVFETSGLHDTFLLSAPTHGNRSGTTNQERAAIRRMMSRYWFNSSPFSLDLVGAVVRQGGFIDKMVGINWVSSPALSYTMGRLITKYERFIGIMAKYPGKCAVPTLDVDLAWHTHQLAPQTYYQYTTKRTMRLINHDDKIEESDLHEAFTWTSKVYQELYKEPYSECTCWYCEAVRESHSSSLDRFRPGLRSAMDNLHDANGNSTVARDPSQSPHISAHNAVRTRDSAIAQQVAHAQLESNYRAACNRARKRGHQPPERDTYYAAYIWGYPYIMPIYYPYAVDPGYSAGDRSGGGGGTGGGGGDVYPSDPGYVATEGEYGACAAGTCGGTAAVGGCGGGGQGTCGGGSSGGGDGGGGGGGDGGGACGGEYPLQVTMDEAYANTRAGCGGGCGGCGGG